MYWLITLDGKSFTVQDGLDLYLIDDETRDILNQVYEAFGKYSAFKLEQMVKEETPYIEVEMQEVI